MEEQEYLANLLAQIGRRQGAALERRLAPVEAQQAELLQMMQRVLDRLDALEADRPEPFARTVHQMQVNPIVLDRAIHEAEIGNWEPWVWAEDAGVSELELRRALAWRMRLME